MKRNGKYIFYFKNFLWEALMSCYLSSKNICRAKTKKSFKTWNLQYSLQNVFSDTRLPLKARLILFVVRLVLWYNCQFLVWLYLLYWKNWYEGKKFISKKTSSLTVYILKWLGIHFTSWGMLDSKNGVCIDLQVWSLKSHSSAF